MINATETILYAEQALDRETRRKCYIPHLISDVSVHHRGYDSNDTSFAAEKNGLKLRIPLGSVTERSASPAPANALRVHPEAEDLFIVLETIPDESVLPQKCYEEDINALAAQYGYQGRAFRVIEVADNTRRGSSAVRHFRIGGV